MLSGLPIQFSGGRPPWSASRAEHRLMLADPPTGSPRKADNAGWGRHRMRGVAPLPSIPGPHPRRSPPGVHPAPARSIGEKPASPVAVGCLRNRALARFGNVDRSHLFERRSWTAIAGPMGDTSRRGRPGSRRRNHHASGRDASSALPGQAAGQKSGRLGWVPDRWRTVPGPGSRSQHSRYSQSRSPPSRRVDSANCAKTSSRSRLLDQASVVPA
jgi:hypothetical protein